jgi:CDP-diacylglycerol---glycerol-3-phosphate 3-phosphatidyltransferase
VLSVYSLKPKFQEALRPLVQTFASAGITANQITVTTCLLSIVLGIFLTLNAQNPRWFLLLPAFFFIRMAFNAIDGMLAREFHQKSNLGAYLNELSDVISDAFLYLPFAYVRGFDPLSIGAVIVLSVTSELAGTIALMTGASRRYDGPMGKSDRALVFGALAFWLGAGLEIASWASTLFPMLVSFLLALTIVNRVRNALAEVANP